MSRKPCGFHPITHMNAASTRTLPFHLSPLHHFVPSRTLSTILPNTRVSDITQMVSYVSGGTKRRTDEVCAKAKRGGTLFFFLPPPLARAEPRSLSSFSVRRHPPTSPTHSANSLSHWHCSTLVARTPVRAPVKLTARAHPALTAHLFPCRLGPSLEPETLRVSPNHTHECSEYEDATFSFIPPPPLCT